MVIPDIQLVNATTPATMPPIGAAANPTVVAAISPGNKTDTSTNSDSQNMPSSNESTKVTLSSQKKRAAKEKDATPPEQVKAQQKAASEYSLAMTGIPLYNGKLISVVKYPDGNSEMFDAFTGQRITQEDLALMGALHSSGGEQVLHFESKTSYSNLSAAEVYQQIQEMLHSSGDQEELS
ncbi:hypothetical protein [Pectobacterium aquaticum]|uniref:Uncharacterized protein n=1 Tax=Pectobacterium aquaticum TaxID=2204145 RepID=A0AA93AP30_9GAMM|nr:hypothetical protein [Pectobacterium aquaticum]PLY35654.1 hypothetical protein F164LOC_19355 [Pectobacterium carotovorum]MCH5051030.1 hypothetical protein [Pectobacterium aquaticum]RRN99583.1 hypothetical protein DMB83_017940 [Pectobacterium aquaticum]RRO06392.1 hypothetical protein DMB81_013095 [Pectobacterium aquaticum]RRO07340.1 hypothetical protein DMB85_013195 [Pectobacterium aquaticum]